MRLGSGIGSTSQDRATWLALLALLLGVLAPAVCVLWFMNEAVRNQDDAARQRISEAYRGQLRLLRDRIDADWKTRLADLNTSLGTGPAAFRRAVDAGLVDALVFFDDSGSPEYPSLAVRRARDVVSGRDDWRTARSLEDVGNRTAAALAYAAIAARERDPSLAARAAQAHVRALVQAGDAALAILAIEKYFTSGRIAGGRDLHGRLIGADAQLLALRLLKPTDDRYTRATQRLAALLDDYDRTVMPSGQRLFLMDELRAVAPDVRMPTHAAERLAADFLQSDGMRPEGSMLESARGSGVWKLRVHGSAVALFTTETVVALSRRILDQQSAPSGAGFSVIPPGSGGGDEAIAASPLLPGWQISFSTLDAERIEEASRTRMATYLWAGTLAIALLAVAGLLLWQSFRRQMRLTRLKTDLIAAVSHELKTPLASMRMLVDSLLEDDELDRKKARNYLGLIAGENARLSRLIEHFLTFSRMERHRQRFVFGDIHPSMLVQSTVDLMRERFDAADLRVEIDAGLPPLYADRDALVTVLLNLMENAYKYTPADKRISLHAYREGERVIFEVEDNGIGIAPRDQKRIFRRFYQVDQSLARDTGGCGLGLSIVDFIVRAHGGAVAVRSEIGVGSTFRVSMPCRVAKGAVA